MSVNGYPALMEKSAAQRSEAPAAGGVLFRVGVVDFEAGVFR
jgi:hypothetical protein